MAGWVIPLIMSLVSAGKGQQDKTNSSVGETLKSESALHGGSEGTTSELTSGGTAAGNTSPSGSSGGSGAGWGALFSAASGQQGQNNSALNKTAPVSFGKSSGWESKIKGF